MPEGPETLRQVDFIRSQFKHPLNEYILIQVANLTGRFKFDINLFNPALDQPIVNISCKGKFYFLQFGANVGVVCHHGMNGWWSTTQEDKSQVEFIFTRRLDDGEYDDKNVVLLYFTNVELGDFKVCDVDTVRNGLAGGFIGEHQVSIDDFMAGLDTYTHRKRLRDILFDQHSVCSGLGNYLIAEIMYEMHLHPMAKLGDLKKEGKWRLYDVCKEITTAFYEGKRQKVVYGRDKDPHGNQVLTMTVGTRTAHWVKEIQTIGA